MNKKENENYHLLHISNDNDMVIIKDLGIIKDAEYKQIKSDKQIINNYFNNHNLFLCIGLNMQQFLEAIACCTADYHKTRQMNTEIMESIHLDLNRHLLNVLSMFRSFLDHTDTSFSREFGPSSFQKTEWTKFTNSLYDSSFEYRFVYKLRNYAQHVGLPPLNISFENSMDQEGTTFRLDFSKNELVKEKDLWNAKILEDLKSKPDNIPVLDILNNWSNCIKDIPEKINELRLPQVKESAMRIFSYRAKHPSLPIGSLCIGTLPAEKEDLSKINFKLDWLPEDKAFIALNR